MVSEEEFIEGFLNRVRSYTLISPDSYAGIVKKIDDYDMLFRLANSNLLIVLVEIELNAEPSECKTIKIISWCDKRYAVCCMYSDASGFKLLKKYNRYNYIHDKYFRKVNEKINIQHDKNKKSENEVISHIKEIITKEMLVDDIIKDYPHLHASVITSLNEERICHGNLTKEELQTKKNLCYTMIKFWCDALKRQIPMKTPNDIKDEDRIVTSLLLTEADHIRFKNLTNEIIKEFEVAFIKYFADPKNYKKCICFDVDYSPNEKLINIGKLMKEESWEIISAALPIKTTMTINNFSSINCYTGTYPIMTAPESFSFDY